MPKVEVFKSERLNQPIKEQLKDWNNEIAELENYFAKIKLPTQPLKLNNCSTILSCSAFIESHLTTLKANNGNKIFMPYLNRLHDLRQKMTSNYNSQI